MPLTQTASLRVGLHALRANPMRTVLSTLGVVMGVGAMVSVLSMGDGVEVFAREQIARTTDLLAVTVTPLSGRRLDGVLVPRTDVVTFSEADAEALRQSLATGESAYAFSSGPTTIQRDTTTPPRGALVYAGVTTLPNGGALTLASGRFFGSADAAASVVLTDTVAAVLAGADGKASLIDRPVWLNGRRATVLGILTPRPREPMTVYIPLPLAPQVIMRTGAPAPTQLVAVAPRVEEVEAVRQAVERFLVQRFGAAWAERVSVASNLNRVRQSAQALMIFKLLMAAITGVSLLVGGVGIMNVLLASVAERTREIGIRKAAGARHRDIMAQFLAESVAITMAGAFVGVLLGFAIAFLTAWIMRVQTSAQVHAAVTLPTILFAALAAIAVGLGFGLYPALRAARLSAIDAIRHE